MATPDIAPFNKYIGNGATTQFSVGFPYIDTDFIHVYIKRADSDQEEVEATDWEWVNETTIRFPATGSSEAILADGEVLVVQRETPTESEFTFANQKRLFPEDVMKADDLEMQILQEQARELDRAIKVEPTSPVDPEELVNEVERMYQSIDNIDTVAQNISDVNNVSDNMQDVNDCADNMAAIQDAPTQASNAADSASNASTSETNAQKWAEGSDADVEALGGTHSAKGWANQQANNYQVTATGSTTARALKDRFADIINVKDFGAKGDGLTDDTDAFNAAGASEKAVFVPEGSYNLSSYINHKNFIIGRNVSFPNKTVHYKPYSNTYKKSIVFSMGQNDWAGYEAAKIQLGATSFWPQGWDYDEDGNVYIIFEGNNQSTALVKLDSSYNYVGWIQLPYGTENPVILKKNNGLYCYIRYSGELTEYNISNVQWTGDVISSGTSKIKYCQSQYDYCDGVWYILGGYNTISGSASNNYARNTIRRYDSNFNYLGTFTLPVSIMGTNHDSSYYKHITKTQGFRVVGRNIYISQGVGRNLVNEEPYYPSLDLGITEFSVDNKAILRYSMLNSEKLKDWFVSKGYTVNNTETEGLAVHPSGSVHNMYVTGASIIIMREFDDSGIDFSDIASSYVPVDIDKLQNELYPVFVADDGTKKYIDVFTGEEITSITGFLEMMVNLNLHRLSFCTSTLSVSGIGTNDIPTSSSCILINSNNVTIHLICIGNDTSYGFRIVKYTKSGDTWAASNEERMASQEFMMFGDNGFITYRDYSSWSDYYKLMRFKPSDTGLSFGSDSDSTKGPKLIEFRASKSDGTSTRREFAISFSAAYPGVNNAINLGDSSHLWKEVYASNATINTSDERQKQEIAPVDERVFKAWSKVEFKQFLFNDAVAEKGKDKARIHFGLIAQRVKEAFESEGLDGFKYGLLCYDEWDDEYEDVEVIDKEAEYDEEGNEISPVIKHTEKHLRTKAGNAYGIRYGEALALECAYQRWITEKLEKRLEALEGK